MTTKSLPLRPGNRGTTPDGRPRPAAARDLIATVVQAITGEDVA